MAGTAAEKRRYEDREWFSTGMVADLCGVAPRTAQKWADSGTLRAIRIPGSLDRRVARADLIEFMEVSGFPTVRLDPELVGRPVVLVALTEHLEGKLAEYLVDLRVEAVESVFDAGLLVHECWPRAVVVDLSVGTLEAQRVAAGVRRAEGPDPGPRSKKRRIDRALLVALAGEDGTGNGLTGYDRVIPAPVDPMSLAGLIRAGREG